MSWIDESITQYYNWLRDKTFLQTDQGTGWSVITTPFVGLFNDPIEVYVKQDGLNIVLSDDGQTVRGLEQVGVQITRSPKRQEWLYFILRNYGIEFNGCELTTTATSDNFIQRKHNLISAIIEMSDMEMMSKHQVASLFREDVRKMFDERNIIYTPQFIAKGSTGLEFVFDFQIASRTKELVIKSFNSINKSNVANFLFGWEDVKSVREKVSGKELLGLAVINDIDKEVKQDYISALESKNTLIVNWSERDIEGNRNKFILSA